MSIKVKLAIKLTKKEKYTNLFNLTRNKNQQFSSEDVAEVKKGLETKEYIMFLMFAYLELKVFMEAFKEIVEGFNLDFLRNCWLKFFSKDCHYLQKKIEGQGIVTYHIFRLGGDVVKEDLFEYKRAHSVLEALKIAVAKNDLESFKKIIVLLDSEPDNISEKELSGYIPKLLPNLNRFAYLSELAKAIIKKINTDIIDVQEAPELYEKILAFAARFDVELSEGELEKIDKMVPEIKKEKEKEEDGKRKEKA